MLGETLQYLLDWAELKATAQTKRNLVNQYCRWRNENESQILDVNQLELLIKLAEF